MLGEKGLMTYKDRDLLGRDLIGIYKKNNADQKIIRKYAADHNIDPNGIDHYFHRKTMYEAAQKGAGARNVMFMYGTMKESRDILRDTKKNWKENKGQDFLPRLLNSLGGAWSEAQKDLQNNIIGYRMGLNNELPPESNPEFNKYNSATMNLILERLKGQK